MSLSNRTTLDQLRGMTAAQAAALPLDHLALLLGDAAALKADAKLLGDVLHDALHVRFADAAHAARRAEGKDTGRIRLVEDGVEVIADLPKRVEWSQAQLADAVRVLCDWGEDPDDYLATELRVPEARFTAWPPRIRALFEPARTVSTGRPAYTLQLKDSD